MFTAFKTEQIPTVIDHCVHCYFLDNLNPVLLLVASNYLNVFSITVKETLELRHRFRFCSNIQSIQPCTLPKSSKDAVILAFSDAKVSVVDFDPATQDLRTLSMHCYDEEFLFKGQIYNIYPPVVRVDNEMRCAAVLSFNCKMITISLQATTATKPSSCNNLIESYLVDLHSLDEWLQLRIIDFQFLSGFNQPTVVIACEPKRTWVGRLAVKKDTCALMGLSMNIHKKHTSIIWRLNSLPYDIVGLLPVLHPIGGVMVITMNALIYACQSTAICGVGVNSNVEHSTNLRLGNMRHLKISLDLSKAAFIDRSRIVLCLKTGEILIATVLFDALHTTGSKQCFIIEKCAVSSPAECVCTFKFNDSQLFFIGSRLGNSVLLKCTTTIKETNDVQNSDDIKAIPDNEPFDEISELYQRMSNRIVDSDKLTLFSYSFAIADIISNYGPYGQTTIAPPSFLADEMTGCKRNQFDLVSIGGCSKTACISIQYQTIRPQIVTSIELPDCDHTWTVRSSEDNSIYHDFLIISQESGSTVVLQTGQDITEVDSSGFDTESSTVMAGNIGDSNLIIQITPKAAYLMKGIHRIQKLELVGADDPVIVSADVTGRFVAICNSANKLSLIVLDDSSETPLISLDQNNYKPNVLLHTCFADKIGLIAGNGKPFTTSVNPDIDSGVDNSSVEDSLHDDILFSYIYNDRDQSNIKNNICDYEIRLNPLNDITYWVFVITNLGSLQILSLPDLECVFQINQFSSLPKLCVDDLQQLQPESNESQKRDDSIKEIKCVCAGKNSSQIYLMVRTDNELIIYKTFLLCANQICQLRLKKQNQHRLIRPIGKHINSASSNLTRRLLIPFNNINNCEGAMLCGSMPCWIFISDSTGICIHPMDIDGQVKTFSEFSNVNCPNGFLYINDEDHLRIAELPPFSYNSNWPVRKIALRNTVDFLTYCVRSSLFALVMHTSTHVDQIMQLSGEDKEVVTYSRDEHSILPERDHFFLQLYNADWTSIPKSRIDLNEWEHISCLKSVRLKSAGHRGTINEYIAMSTVYCYNEDVNARGRIILLEVIDVVPEPNQPLSRHKIKIVCEQEEKGPVTVLDCVNGYLIGAVGQKVFLWQYKDQSLTGIAFIDVSIYIHQLTVIKNFIIMVDVLKGVSLIRFQEDMRVLSFVARDKRNLDIYSTDFLVHGNQLAFIVNDPDQNMFIYYYDPEAPDSRAGFFLCQRSAFNTMSCSTCGVRLRCPPLQQSEDYCDMSECIHVNYFPTLEGGMFKVMPLNEKRYRRLQVIQNLITLGLPHTCGLNPKTARACKFRAYDPYPITYNTIDMDLVNEFLYLSTPERKEICRRSGFTIDQILEDLSVFQHQSHVF
ncbi:hypothetical protein GJ496_001342 [Pomphorhynchus laevis]|nr:hypothetical protein GJ496_001342 [Pomphorhynchus laevis]